MSAWPNAWEGGHARGRTALRDYWTRQWAAIDPEVRPTAFAALPGDRVDVQVHQLARTLDGTALTDTTVHHSYTFRGGPIARMEVRS